MFKELPRLIISLYSIETLFHSLLLESSIPSTDWLSFSNSLYINDLGCSQYSSKSSSKESVKANILSANISKSISSSDS